MYHEKNETASAEYASSAVWQTWNLWLEAGGGKRGDAQRLREQMNRLFRCHISFTRSEMRGNRPLRPAAAPLVPLHGPDGLAEQIGSDYSRPDNFKAALAEGLEAVKTVWPQLNYELSTTRLTVKKSPVPIPAVVPLEKSRRLGAVQAAQLSVHTEVWFKTTYPKHSLAAVKKGYRAFLAKNSITPTRIDAHFQDYAKKWIDGEF